ncbi:MAG TPA: hypothetical protein VM364_03660 [Vicinamibacterales bacterium]|nr:hypothetical protein [Vicinamibacterales bacterium]
MRVHDVGDPDVQRREDPNCSEAIISESTARAGAAVLLTFNPRHFDPAPKVVTVVVSS